MNAQDVMDKWIKETADGYYGGNIDALMLDSSAIAHCVAKNEYHRGCLRTHRVNRDWKLVRVATMGIFFGGHLVAVPTSDRSRGLVLAALIAEGIPTWLAPSLVGRPRWMADLIIAHPGLATSPAWLDADCFADRRATRLAWIERHFLNGEVNNLTWPKIWDFARVIGDAQFSPQASAFFATV
jgi:hypothetical protein